MGRGPGGCVEGGEERQHGRGVEVGREGEGGGVWREGRKGGEEGEDVWR